MAIDIVKATSTHNTTAKSNRSLSYIVFHYTAGVSSKAGTAKAVASMFSTMSGQASADFIVDDSTIVQYNPDLRNRYCWHCGDGSGGTYGGQCWNSNSIGIEVCCTNSTGKITSANDQYFSFTDAALNKARELINYLMETYNIPVSHVIRHYDVSCKWCPGVRGWIPVQGYSDNKWTAFKDSLTGKSSTTAAETSTASNSTAKAETVNTAPCVASGMQKFKNSTGASMPVYCSSRMQESEKIGSLNSGESCYCFGKVYSKTAARWMWLVAYSLDAYPGDYKVGYVDDGGGTDFK